MNMLNQVVLVGRIAKEPKLVDLGDDRKECNLKVAIQRQYKNEDGIYETDFVSCILYKGMAENVTDYCRQGDLIGIKGRLETKNDELVLVADKVTFLSSAKVNEEE